MTNQQVTSKVILEMALILRHQNQEISSFYNTDEMPKIPTLPHREIQPNKKTSEFMSLLEESRLEFTKQ